MWGMQNISTKATPPLWKKTVESHRQSEGVKANPERCGYPVVSSIPFLQFLLENEAEANYREAGKKLFSEKWVDGVSRPHQKNTVVVCLPGPEGKVLRNDLEGPPSVHCRRGRSFATIHDASSSLLRGNTPLIPLTKKACGGRAIQTSAFLHNCFMSDCKADASGAGIPDPSRWSVAPAQGDEHDSLFPKKSP
jgi:hypothetical protein